MFRDDSPSIPEYSAIVAVRLVVPSKPLYVSINDDLYYPPSDLLVPGDEDRDGVNLTGDPAGVVEVDEDYVIKLSFGSLLYPAPLDCQLVVVVQDMPRGTVTAPLTREEIRDSAVVNRRIVLTRSNHTALISVEDPSSRCKISYMSYNDGGISFPVYTYIESAPEADRALAPILSEGTGGYETVRNDGKRVFVAELVSQINTGGEYSTTIRLEERGGGTSVAEYFCYLLIDTQVVTSSGIKEEVETQLAGEVLAGTIGRLSTSTELNGGGREPTYILAQGLARAVNGVAEFRVDFVKRNLTSSEYRFVAVCQPTGGGPLSRVAEAVVVLPRGVLETSPFFNPVDIGVLGDNVSHAGGDLYVAGDPSVDFKVDTGTSDGVNVCLFVVESGSPAATEFSSPPNVIKHYAGSRVSVADGLSGIYKLPALPDETVVGTHVFPDTDTRYSVCVFYVDADGVFSTLNKVLVDTPSFFGPSLRILQSSGLDGTAVVGVDVTLPLIIADFDSTWVLCTHDEDSFRPSSSSHVQDIIDNETIGGNYVKSGSSVDGGSSSEIDLSPLTAGVTYVLYVFLSDGTDTSSLSSIEIYLLSSPPTFTVSTAVADRTATVSFVPPPVSGDIYLRWVLCKTGSMYPQPSSVLEIDSLLFEDESFVVARSSTLALGNPAEVMLTGLALSEPYTFYGYISTIQGGTTFSSVELELMPLPEPAFNDPALSVANRTITLGLSSIPAGATELLWVLCDDDSENDLPSDVAGIERLVNNDGAAVAASVRGGAPVGDDVVLTNLAFDKEYTLYACFRGSVVFVTEGLMLSVPEPEVTIATSDISHSSVTVEVSNGTDLELYWAVLLTSETAPTADEIVSSSDLSGNVEISMEGTEVVVMGLTPSTDYTFYAIFRVSFMEGDDSVNVDSDIASMDFVTVAADPPVNLSTLGLGDGVSVFPNPVLDVLQVVAPSVGVLVIYTVSGAVVDSHDMVVGVNQFSFIDYPSGAYVLRLVFAGEEVRYRVVRQ